MKIYGTLSMDNQGRISIGFAFKPGSRVKYELDTDTKELIITEFNENDKIPVYSTTKIDSKGRTVVPHWARKKLDTTELALTSATENRISVIPYPS